MHAAKALSNWAWIDIWVLEDLAVLSLSGDRAAGRANACTPAAANRPAQPCTERRRQRRRTEATKVSPLHLVRHGLLGELSACCLIVLETCERCVRARHHRNGGTHGRLRAGT